MSAVAHLFDLVEREAAHRVGWLTVPQVREARAAVAELVAAADECQDLLSASGDAGAEPGSYGRDCYDAMMRCRAALAKFEEVA